MRGVVTWIFLAAVAAAIACSNPTDLGKPCTLVKLNPADGGVTDVLPSDIGDAGMNEDFVSFGTSECEDLVCILDAAHMPSALQAAQQNPGLGIQGYCSKVCDLGSKTECAQQYQSGLQSTPGMAMTCRALVLDPATLNALCNSNPAECQSLFGGNPGSTYCARGGDAGA